MNGLSARRVAEHLLGFVEFIMPGERKEWARAMRAEAAFVERDEATLTFAMGCLWACCVECLVVEIRKNAAVLPAATAIGVVFFVHAAVDGSRAWPFIWPLLGGILAVLSRMRHGTRSELRSGVSFGFRTGAIAGLFFAVAGTVLISASEGVTLHSRLHILAMGTLVGAGLTAIGGGAAALLTRLR